jgi:hypothetical protein
MVKVLQYFVDIILHMSINKKQQDVGWCYAFNDIQWTYKFSTIELEFFGNSQIVMESLNYVNEPCIYFSILFGKLCRTPTLTKCGGEAQHLEKLGFGVLRNSWMFRAQQQGAKHLALGCSWCHWKGLET